MVLWWHFCAFANWHKNKYSKASHVQQLKYNGPVKYTCQKHKTVFSKGLTYSHMLICTHTQKIPDKTHKIIDRSVIQPLTHAWTPPTHTLWHTNTLTCSAACGSSCPCSGGTANWIFFGLLGSIITDWEMERKPEREGMCVCVCMWVHVCQGGRE